MRVSKDSAHEFQDGGNASLPEIVIFDQDNASLWLMLKLMGAAPSGTALKILASSAGVPELLARAEDSLAPILVVLGYARDFADPFHLLRKLKADAVLRHYPAVCLLPSGHDELVSQAYEALANAVAPEPSTLDGCALLLRELAEYWFSIVTPSPRSPASS